MCILEWLEWASQVYSLASAKAICGTDPGVAGVGATLPMVPTVLPLLPILVPPGSVSHKGPWQLVRHIGQAFEEEAECRILYTPPHLTPCSCLNFASLGFLYSP